MARTFHRDSRGRFAATGTTKSGKASRTPEEREAMKASEQYKELQRERAVDKAEANVDNQAFAVKTAETDYKNAKRLGTDSALESAWKQRINARRGYAAALRRLAKAKR